MTASIIASPDPIGPGQRMNVSGKAFDLHAKVTLLIVDDLCNEVVGATRTLPKRDGSWSGGENAPKARGTYRIKALQRNVTVAEFRGTVT